MAINKVEICGVDTSTLPVLKNERMRELFPRVHAGDKEARREFIQGNLRLVLSVIQRFHNRGESVDDLFQVGCIGLMKAIDNFDTGQNVRFSTYAVPMIIGEIRRYLRDNNQIRVSRSLRDTAYKALKARERLTYRLGREPNIQEIAAEMEVREEDVVLALEAIQDPVSLFDPVYQDGGDAIYVMDQVRDERVSEDEWVRDLSIRQALENSASASATSSSAAFSRGARRWRSPARSASPRRRSRGWKRPPCNRCGAIFKQAPAGRIAFRRVFICLNMLFRRPRFQERKCLPPRCFPAHYGARREGALFPFSGIIEMIRAARPRSLEALMEDLFSAGMKKLAPLADRMRPRTLSEFIGQEQIVGKGKPPAPRHRGRPPDQLHLLGPAGHGQDHAGLHHRGDHARRLRAAQRRHQRRSRRARRTQGGRTAPARPRPADLPASGRVPPLVQGAVGLHFARHRARRHPLHGLHHGEPDDRHDPGHRQPLPPVSASSGSRARASKALCGAPSPTGSAAMARRTCASTRTPLNTSPAWPTATPAPPSTRWSWRYCPRPWRATAPYTSPSPWRKSPSRAG